MGSNLVFLLNQIARAMKFNGALPDGEVREILSLSDLNDAWRKQAIEKTGSSECWQQGEFTLSYNGDYSLRVEATQFDRPRPANLGNDNFVEVGSWEGSIYITLLGLSSRVPLRGQDVARICIASYPGQGIGFPGGVYEFALVLPDDAVVVEDMLREGKCIRGLLALKELDSEWKGLLSMHLTSVSGEKRHAARLIWEGMK